MEHLGKELKSKNFSLLPLARWKSLGHAANGFFSLLREPNAKIHFIATVIVVGLGFAKRLNKFEWCFVLLAISMVWIVEALNTAIEKLCDLYTTAFHPLIKIIKDIAAAAALLAAIASAIIGILIFLL